ncbi:MAG: nucleotidyltransferase [Lachnospiraceae bacterium]|nr:nucleotidyltransferase [Lachnospiraceae bacterium]
MKTVGIIAEYNPFHNGHAYHIAKAKEMTGADYCIVVMSGSFVQRGAPAIADKYIRAEAALLNGADLVLELPVYYALGSAEYFSSGAVALLDKLGVTDTLCFGSECGDLSLLSEFAQRLLGEDEQFKQILSRHLKRGLTYPNARNIALEVCAPHLNAHMNVLTSPNNILGIEYCKALYRRSSRIQPYTLRRAGASYHDASLSSSYCSALAIRQAISSAGSDCLVDVRQFMPQNSYELLAAQYHKTFPILPDDLSLPLHYQLLSEQSTGYTDYADIDGSLSARIVKNLSSYRNFTDFCELLKTKNKTYTHIARSLLHILLRIRQDDFLRYRSEDYIYYARMLGFCKGAEPLLAAIKAHSSIPLLSKLADADALLTENGRNMLAKDIYAGHIYQSIVQNKFPAYANTDTEYTRQIRKV